MNKKEAFAKAKEVFPNNPVTRVGGIAGLMPGLVLVTGWDERVVLVVYSRTDLLRLRAACDRALYEDADNE